MGAMPMQRLKRKACKKRSCVSSRIYYRISGFPGFPASLNSVVAFRKRGLTRRLSQQEYACSSFQSVPRCAHRTCQTFIFTQNWLAFEPLNKHLLRLLNGSKKGDATYLAFGLFQSLFLQDSALTNTIARSPGQMSWHFNSLT